MIQKINGKGSFVTRPSDAPDLGPLTGFFDHMRATGREAVGKTLSVRDVEAPAAVAEALGLPVGTPIKMVTMVRMVDGNPLVYGVVHGLPAMVQALIREDIETNDMMTLLESRLGHRLKSTHIETSALPAGKLRSRHLGVAPDAPVLRIRFTPHDVSDRPLLHADMFFRGDGFSYKAVVKR
jgi:GntR family transcriptional regulator